MFDISSLTDILNLLIISVAEARSGNTAKDPTVMGSDMMHHGKNTNADRLDRVMSCNASKWGDSPVGLWIMYEFFAYDLLLRFPMDLSIMGDVH